LRTSDEYLDIYTRIQPYLEGPQSDKNVLAKTGDLSPWFGHENTAMDMFPWPYKRAMRQFSTCGLVSPSRSPFLPIYIPLQRTEMKTDREIG